LSWQTHAVNRATAPLREQDFTAPAVTCQYDGSGRRVMRTEGGQTTYTMYSQGGQLLHKEEGGVGTDYVYTGNMLVATKQGSTVNYVHLDLLSLPIDGRAGSTNYTENYTQASCGPQRGSRQRASRDRND
jgi:hypothetical protein